MKKQHYKHSISIPLYRGRLEIEFTNNQDVYAQTANFDDESYDAYRIVLNFNHKFRRITHGVIAHEAVHAAHMLMENRGIEDDVVNDEPMTYLVEWITDKIYGFMDKHNLKASIKGD